MHRTMDGSVVEENVMASYYEILDKLLETAVGEGVFCTGLILRDEVDQATT